MRFDPDKETRNRKPLEQPVAFEATWELRFGPENRFRVFYAVRPRKSAGLPIYKFRGAYRNTVPVYITGGYYREGRGIPELVQEVRG